MYNGHDEDYFLNMGLSDFWLADSGGDKDEVEAIDGGVI